MLQIVRRLIRADGTGRDLHGPMTMNEICRLIGAKATDAVSLRHMSGPLHVMIVDDKGYETETIETEQGIELRPVRALKPVNVMATALYHLNCKPGTTHEIVGDVVIVPDSDFE